MQSRRLAFILLFMPQETFGAEPRQQVPLPGAARQQ